MEEQWFEALGKTNLISLIKSDSTSLGEFIKENIAKMMFYSSTAEGNMLNQEGATLLMDGKLIRDGGKLNDYFEIVNHEEACEEVMKLSKKEVKLQDIVDIRRILFHGIIEKHLGIRRFRNSAGYSVTVPVDELHAELESVIQILNKKPESDLEAFINACEFHLKFAKLHPFEDGVGRTTRLFMNFYLMKSSLKPMVDLVPFDKYYNYGLSFMEFANFGAPFTLSILTKIAYCDRTGLKEGVDSLGIGSAYDMAIKDMLLILTESADPKQIEQDARLLYQDGMKTDVSLTLTALWLLSSMNICNGIIKAAINEKDGRVRGAGLLSIDMMELASKEDYKKCIIDMAKTDASPENRLLALSVLNRKSLIDADLADWVMANEKDDAVLCKFANCMSAPYKFEQHLRIIGRLMESDSLTVKRRAYSAFILNASKDEIVDCVVRHISKVEDVVVDTIIETLYKANMLNDVQIVKILSSEMIDNTYMRRKLLSNLCKCKEVDGRYITVVESLLFGTGLTTEEHAHALYLVGREKGYEYISQNCAAVMSNERDTIDNIATFLVYAKELEANRGSEPKLNLVLNLEDSKLNYIESIELGRLLGENKVGTHFLELYMKEFRMWKSS
jgi:fido (protein-threonine AMPylation protein)/SOS response regulatory protein OraA/RecX